MECVAEFYEGCMQGRHVIDVSREEWRAVRRPNPVKFDDKPEIHVYRRTVRCFGEFISPKVRAEIIKERGEYVYVLDRVESLST